MTPKDRGKRGDMKKLLFEPIKERNKEIAQLYEDGISVKTLAKTYKISKSWAHRIVKKDIPVRPTNKLRLTWKDRRITLMATKGGRDGRKTSR